MSGIIAFFQALPAILTLISRLGNVLDALNKAAEQNNLNGWIDSLEQAVKKLEQAKTSQEKLDAAQFLVGAIRSIGPK